MDVATEPARDWIIKRYEDGDEIAILELFNSVFGLHRSLEHWRWQFKDNPYAGPFASQARLKADGSLVGTHIVMPFQLNVMGRPLLAAQTLDLVVHPDYRMQGIFESAALDCFESFKGAGVRAVVAFPNASSYPGFVRTLGWMRLLFPRTFVLRLDVEDALHGLLRLRVLAKLLNAAFRLYQRVRFRARRRLIVPRVGTGLSYARSESVPEAYERLWQSCRSQEVLSVWKDSRYFRWRYDENPDHEFSYHYLVRGGEIQALVVAVERERAITLCECVVANRDVPMGSLLIAEICLFYQARRVRTVHFMGSDAGFFAEVFAGFRSRSAFENVFVGRALADAPLQEMMARPENWNVTFGDADFV